jgi:hypothetical protein
MKTENIVIVTLGILAFNSPTPQPTGLGILLIAVSSNIILGIIYKTIWKKATGDDFEKLFWISCTIIVMCFLYGMSWGLARLAFLGTIVGIGILELVIYKD